MSSKGSVGFNKDQVQQLATAGYGVKNALEAAFDSIEKDLLSKVESEEIFGDSEQKDGMLDSMNEVRSLRKDINEKIDRMIKKIEEVASVAGVKANQNISSMADANATLAAARKAAVESK